MSEKKVDELTFEEAMAELAARAESLAEKLEEQQGS